MKRWTINVGGIVFIWHVVLAPVAAQQDFEVQRAALKEIRETAADICVTVEQKGKKDNTQLTGEVQAKVTGVVAKLADLGVKGSGEISSQEYLGVSQEALATALSDIRTCRQHVFDKLVDKILPPQNSVVTPREVGKPTGSSRDTQGSLSNVLYETGTEKGGFGSWLLTQDWKPLSSILINDGTGQGINPIFAPYRPRLPDYAVEAEIRVGHGDKGFANFGLAIRVDGREGYAAGLFNIRPGYGRPNVAVLENRSLLVRGQVQSFTFGSNWHTYRIEVKGNAITLLIDNGVRTSVTDNRFLSPGRVEIWSEMAQIEVRIFKITTLETMP